MEPLGSQNQITDEMTDSKSSLSAFLTSPPSQFKITLVATDATLVDYSVSHIKMFSRKELTTNPAITFLSCVVLITPREMLFLYFGTNTSLNPPFELCSGLYKSDSPLSRS